MLDDPHYVVRTAAFSVAPMRKGFLLREDKWAYIQYAEDASAGSELFDTENDPHQYDNLAGVPAYQPVVNQFRQKLAQKLSEIRDNDLGG
jgi:iduronate 2-sulfatase